MDRLRATNPWTALNAPLRDNRLTTDEDFTAPNGASRPTTTLGSNIHVDLRKPRSATLAPTPSKGLAVKRFEGSSPFASTRNTRSDDPL